MDKDKLKKLFNELDIPEPGEGARQNAIQKAMDEFARQKQEAQETAKGIGKPGRLTGKLREKIFSGGMPVMKKLVPIALTAVVAIVVASSFMIRPFHADREKAIERVNEITVRPSTGQPSTSPAPEEAQAPERYAAQQAKPEKKQPADVKKTPPQPAKAQAPEHYEVSKPKSGDDAYVFDHGYDASKGPAQPEEQAQVMSEEVPAGKTKLAKEEVVGAFRMVAPRIVQVPARQPVENQEYVGRDSFEKLTPNPVKLAAEEPVSTFSIDVDTSAYAFVRRALMSGHLPQKNSVRIEEMINYFDYDYELAEDRKKPFKPTVAVYPTPWNPDTKLLHIGIKGHDIVSEKKPRSNLVFLIDVSGSMSSRDKLPLLKNSLAMLVETLAPEDTVAMVVYAGAAGTVLEPTKVKEKGKILAALDKLSAGGSTAGGEGIRLAYSLAEANFDRDAVNRVILATDGDFNVGIRDPEELKGFIERKRDSGVYLSVLGFGQGNYRDDLMQKLAQNGNGNAAYIDTLNEARKVLVDEASSTLFTIAKDVKIQIEFNPTVVAEYRLIGYETRQLKREDFNNDKVDAGDIGAGHSVTAIYEITPVGSKARLLDDLRYRESAPEKSEKSSKNEYAFLKMRFKLPDSEKSTLVTKPIGKESDYTELENVPGEVRFAAAVAAFGQILRGDPYTKDFTFDDVLALAEPARGRDSFGYRGEFLNLVRLAKTARAMGTR
jgi:Ca-activated chloride channel family protein